MAKVEFPRFNHPSNIAIYGPSKSGKTYFVKDLILNRDAVFKMQEEGKRFKKIFYFYGSVFQPIFQSIQEELGEMIVFNKGFPKQPFENIILPENRPAMVIFDDLETEIQDNESAQNLITRGSHHMDLTVVMIMQSIYPRGKNSANMFSNFDVSIYFHYSGEDHRLLLRFRAFFHDKKSGDDLLNQYKEWTSKKGGYMVIDKHSDLEDKNLFQIRTGIFPSDLLQNRSRCLKMHDQFKRKFHHTKRLQHGKQDVSSFKKQYESARPDLDLLHQFHNEDIYVESEDGKTIYVERNPRVRKQYLYNS